MDTRYRNTGGGGGSATTLDAEYKSPYDFTVTQIDDGTIQLSSLPITISSGTQVAYIKVFPDSGDPTIYTNGVDGIIIKEDSDILSIYKDDEQLTPFNNNDTYEVGINAQDKGYDASPNAYTTQHLNSGGGDITVGVETGDYTFDASEKTITFTGLGTVNLEQVEQIVNITDNIVIYNPNISGLGGTISTNVLTLDYDTTSMSDGDTLLIKLKYNNSEDYSTSAKIVHVLNPDYGHYTGPEPLVSAQDLTASYADFGSEIDMRGYNRLGVYITTDVNDSENVDLKVLGKHESGGADEYEIDGISVITLWTTGASDSKIYYEFDVGTIPFIQLQAVAGTVGTTAGDLTIVIDKKWRN